MFLLYLAIILVLLYLFLISPRLFHRPSYQPFLGWHYAHRGLHDNESNAPENSMAAFKKAVDSGYGIELDVQLTKDRIAVVFHDETLNRVCGVDGKVRDYTLKELQKFTLCKSQERIPTFAEVLELVSGKTPLIVEIKVHEPAANVCEKADELLQAYKGLYCIESFHPFAVAWYKKNRPAVVRGQLSSRFKSSDYGSKLEHFAVQNLLTNVLCRPDFIAYNHENKVSLSRSLCRRLFSCLSVAWTIRSQQQLDSCRDDFDLFIFERFIPKA